MRPPEHFIFKLEWGDREVLLTDVTDEAEVVDCYCKDCVKHNIDSCDYLTEKGRRAYVTECCPLVLVRGKAKGHEFDYQYCSFGRKKEGEDETD